MKFNTLTQETMNDIIAFMGSAPGGRLLVRTISDELKAIHDQFEISISEKKVEAKTEPVVEPVQ